MFNRIFAALLSLALILPVPALAADVESATWSETASSNNAASPNGWTSGTMLPSQVEPTAREMMAALKRDWDHKGPTLISGGSANAQTLTYAVAPAAYVQGQRFMFIPNFTNTGATTLNVNGLGAVAINVNGGALVGGELRIGGVAEVVYDGSIFRLLSTDGAGSWVAYTPTIACGSGTFTSASATGSSRTVGKTTVVGLVVTVTTLGTCGTTVTATLPNTANGAYVLAGRDNGVSGKMLQGISVAGSGQLTILNYDNSFPAASGAVLQVSGVYQNQ